MSDLTFKGGPMDGRPFGHYGGVFVVVPELIPITRTPTDADAFYVDDWGFVEWVDPDLNPKFRRHQYDARTGEYRGFEVEEL